MPSSMFANFISIRSQSLGVFRRLIGATRVRVAVQKWALSMWLVFGVCAFASFSHASFNRQWAPVRLGQFARSGVFVGGQSQKNLSLIGLAKQVADGGGETLTLSFGDLQGRALKGAPGYFHVSLDAKNSRLVMSLQNLKKTTIDNHDLAVKVADSIFIGSTEMTSDPIDDSVNVTLALRVPVEMKVNIGSAQAANQLIIEMRPVVANGEHLMRKAR